MTYPGLEITILKFPHINRCSRRLETYKELCLTLHSTRLITSVLLFKTNEPVSLLQRRQRVDQHVLPSFYTSLINITLAKPQLQCIAVRVKERVKSRQIQLFAIAHRNAMRTVQAASATSANIKTIHKE